MASIKPPASCFRWRIPHGDAGPGIEGLEPYIKTIGLYRSKARHLIETCRLLLERHGGEVPAERAALEALPGVGRKTANVILNTAFGHPTIAVDTHIFGWLTAPGWRRARRCAVEDRLVKWTPKGLPHGRPPFADSARPLCVQGAQALVRSLCDCRFVRVSGAHQLDAARRCPMPQTERMYPVTLTRIRPLVLSLALIGALSGCDRLQQLRDYFLVRPPVRRPWRFPARAAR